MTATIISNTPPYTMGINSNNAISRIIAVNTLMARIAEAIATASSGYEGQEGTQFEVSVTSGLINANPNLFGVLADPDEPGTQGSAYRYAMDQVNNAWKVFWQTAAPYIEQLDNGYGAGV